MVHALQDRWEGCYAQNWVGTLTSTSMAHPAKFAKGLIFHIVQHAMDEGWLTPGDVCLDPFGGVATGGLPCALQGIQWLGLELESRFITLAHGSECGGDIAKHEACSQEGEHGPHHLLGNLELWERKYGHLQQWVAPILVQGDSRNLCTILAEQPNLSVASPPFLGARAGTTASQPTKGGGPCADRVRSVGTDGNCLGQTPGNITSYPVGSLDATIASSPYANGCTHTGGTDPQPQHIQGGPLRYVQYGADCVASSPPYEDNVNANGHGIDWSKAGPATGNRKRGAGTKHEHTLQAQLKYSTTSDQLGNTQGDTFWESAKVIVANVYALLKPGGHAIWVCKNYVRDGQIVPFSEDWARLCSSVGFQVVHWHKAMLVEQHGTQRDLFGADTTLETRKESFFRRLGRLKGAPAIEWEDVICMVKPLTDNPMPPDEAWQQLDFNPWGAALDAAEEAMQAFPYLDPAAPVKTWGQYEGMKPVSLDACISSSPYVESLTPGNRTSTHAHRQALATEAGHGRLGGGQLTHGARYSFHADNLGNMKEGQKP
jgi:hypothetical protein